MDQPGCPPTAVKKEIEMKHLSVCSTLAAAALAGIAGAQVVNLGNLNATSTLQTIPFVVPVSGPFTSVMVTFGWTAGVNGPYSNEARWTLQNGLAFLGGNPGVGNGAAANSNPATLSWTFYFQPVTSGTSLNFNYRQSLNTSSASWSNVSLTFGNFSAPSSLFLGSINQGGPLTISTGSPTPAFDTILGLFDSAGNLIDSDDDDGPDAFSAIVSNLGLGTYYAAVVDYSPFIGSSGGSAYGYVMRGGNDAGTTTLAVTDGVSTLASPGEALAVGGVNWYSFTVVPTPGAAALLGLGGLNLARRRR